MNKSRVIHLYNYISFEINVYICLYIFWYVIRNIVFLFGLLWFVEILAIVCVKLSCSWSELLCWTEMTANWSESGEKMWKVHMSDLCVSSFSYSTLFYITRALLLVLFFFFAPTRCFLYFTLLYCTKLKFNQSTNISIYFNQKYEKQVQKGFVLLCLLLFRENANAEQNSNKF